MTQNAIEERAYELGSTKQPPNYSRQILQSHQVFDLWKCP
jgi:hypothetical protein